MSMDPIDELRPLCTFQPRQVRIPVPVWTALFWLHGLVSGISLAVMDRRSSILSVLFGQIFNLFLALSMLTLVIYVSWLVVQKAREGRQE